MMNRFLFLCIGLYLLGMSALVFFAALADKPVVMRGFFLGRWQAIVVSLFGLALATVAIVSALRDQAKGGGVGKKGTGNMKGSQ